MISRQCIKHNCFEGTFLYIDAARSVANLYTLGNFVKPVRLVSAVCNFDRPGSVENARV